jgi:hypothetical protein
MVVMAAIRQRIFEEALLAVRLLDMRSTFIEVMCALSGIETTAIESEEKRSYGKCVFRLVENCG